MGPGARRQVRSTAASCGREAGRHARSCCRAALQNSSSRAPLLSCDCDGSGPATCTHPAPPRRRPRRPALRPPPADLHVPRARQPRVLQAGAGTAAAGPRWGDPCSRRARAAAATRALRAGAAPGQRSDPDCRCTGLVCPSPAPPGMWWSRCRPRPTCRSSCGWSGGTTPRPSSAGERQAERLSSFGAVQGGGQGFGGSTRELQAVPQGPAVLRARSRRPSAASPPSQPPPAEQVLARCPGAARRLAGGPPLRRVGGAVAGLLAPLHSASPGCPAAAAPPHQLAAARPPPLAHRPWPPPDPSLAQGGAGLPSPVRPLPPLPQRLPGQSQVLVRECSWWGHP